MTSTAGSASATLERLGSGVMGVRQVTGDFPAADHASVMDMPTAVTKELESVSAAGTTQEEISVTGDNPQVK